jgi:methionyl-tRNA formyltransferase
MRVVVLAPIDNSPFALAVSELCRREPGVELAGIVVRSAANLARIRSELRRDGVRLLRKAWRKLVVHESPEAGGGERGFYDLVHELDVDAATLSGFARRHGVPFLKVRDHNDPASIAFLLRAAPDAVAFTGGGLIRKPVLDASGHGVFNTHMGVLPPYRGMDVVEWPILEGREASVGLGVTLHFMDRGVDTGPILAIRRVPLRDGDTVERLRTRFEPVMVEMMLEGIRQVRDGRLQPISQKKEEGRQYFVMHPRAYARVRRALARRPPSRDA